MTITIGNNSGAASDTVTKPTGAAAGDTVAVALGGSGASGFSIPGFVNQIEVIGVTYGLAILTRVLDGSEGASWTASASSGGVQNNDAQVFIPGAGNVLAIDGTPTSNSAGNGSTATCPSITLANTNDVLLAAFMSSSGGHTTPTGMTEVYDGGTFQNMSFDYQAIASSGSTGTRASTAGGIRMVGVMLALKETTASSPATVLSPALTATALMQVPVVTAAATVAAPLLTATAQLLAPTVSVDIVVAAPVLTATGQMYAPTVTAEAVVAAPLLTATAQFLAPDVGVPNGVTAPLLTATAQLLAPTVTAEALVAAPLLTGTAQLNAPTVSINVIVAVDAPMAATAQLLDPIVTAAATVSAPLLTATAAFLAPAVFGEVWIDSPLLTSSAQFLSPTVLAAAVVGDVPVLTSSAELLAPVVGVELPHRPWTGGSAERHVTGVTATRGNPVLPRATYRGPAGPITATRKQP